MGPARPKSAHWWGKEHARCFLPWRFESSQTHEPGRKVRQVDRACPWQRSFQELWTPLRARPQRRQAELQQLQACCLQRSLDISGSYPRGWGLRSFKALRPIWSLRSIFLEELSQPSTSGSLIVQSLMFSPTMCDPVDCSPSGSSVRGISQTSILEWVATSFSRIL